MIVTEYFFEKAAQFVLKKEFFSDFSEVTYAAGIKEHIIKIGRAIPKFLKNQIIGRMNDSHQPFKALAYFIFALLCVPTVLVEGTLISVAGLGFLALYLANGIIDFTYGLLTNQAYWAQAAYQKDKYDVTPRTVILGRSIVVILRSVPENPIVAFFYYLFLPVNLAIGIALLPLAIAQDFINATLTAVAGALLALPPMIPTAIFFVLAAPIHIVKNLFSCLCCAKNKASKAHDEEPTSAPNKVPHNSAAQALQNTQSPAGFKPGSKQDTSETAIPTPHHSNVFSGLSSHNSTSISVPVRTHDLAPGTF